METVRPCGCKGIRTCLICENEFNIIKTDLSSKLKEYKSYVYCPECDKAWPGWDENLYKSHPNHNGEPIKFPGTYIKLNFLTKDDATLLLKNLDSLPWESSQSGRRKQNYGPKVNFKKKRLRIGNFSGFPETTQFIQKKFADIHILHNFQTIEQCSLEYDPVRGASIDPHIDDCWIWGNRIVTVNVVGDSVLTMTPYNGSSKKYNLDCIDEKFEDAFIDENIVVRLPMPERSLMVLCKESRYKWEHSILREDIKSRRVCLAYREFTPPYLPDKQGNYNKESSEILQRAKCFWKP